MKNKFLKRLSFIGLNTISNLIVSATGMIISLIIIRLFSNELWGEAVYIFLWVNIAAHFASWGSRDFLLRAFSAAPSKSAKTWASVFTARALLIFPFLFLPFFLKLNFAGSIALSILILARFVYQSYDVIILYQRKFTLTVFIELLALVIVVSGTLLLREKIEINTLVICFTFAETIKAIIVAAWYRKEYKVYNLTIPEKDFYISAFPFFVLGFSGLLQSKADLLLVSFFLNKAILSQYQVAMNCFLIVQSGSAFILSPFIKNLYRMDFNRIKKISVRLFWAGAGILFLALPCIFFGLTWIYKFEVSFYSILLGGAFVLPIYIYLPYIYFLYKIKKQNIIVAVNVSSIGICVLFSAIFIPLFGPHYNGALLSIALTQWLILFSLHYLSKRIQSNLQWNQSGILSEEIIVT